MKAFRAYADEWRNVYHFYVEVRVFPTRTEMRADRHASHYDDAPDVEGACSGIEHYNKSGRMTGKFAVMWLNTEDLRANPAELVAHECVHAAMRHIQNRKVDLSNIAGEEALCYTAGSLCRQINDRLHKFKAF